MLEESTLAVNRPMMGVFNNLVMFDQQVAQNSPQSIVPDLATGWSWNEEGTELTMPLRSSATNMGELGAKGVVDHHLPDQPAQSKRGATARCRPPNSLASPRAFRFVPA